MEINLIMITQTEVTMDNVGQVASDVADLTNNTTDIGGDGLIDIAIILENIADVGDTSNEVSVVISDVYDASYTDSKY
jgi:hypothetical protein